MMEENRMRGFSINIEGRAKNFNLPKNQPLIPLFEAIVNAIHAIEERRKDTNNVFQGNIMIRLLREGQIVLDGTNALPDITSFEIIDNGVGFTDPNLESFLESDSTYKSTFGGKGVGRFSWLIAFEKATIESIYKNGDVFVNRTFEFSPLQSEIDDQSKYCEPQTDNKTTIRLVDCKNPYRDNLPKQAETIAIRIIHHCLIYFISENCPIIDLVDDDKSYNLNDMFKERIKTSENDVTFKVFDEEFQLLHVKVEDWIVKGNKLCLCAHNRVVKTKELEKYITDLDSTLYEKNGFWYIGLLKGKYLDDSVDMNRLSFSIPDGGIAEQLTTTITMDNIMEKASEEIERFLAEYLTPIADIKAKRINEYVTKQSPQFRHLLKYMSEEIKSIKPNLSDDKLDDELYKIKRTFDKEVKEQNNQLIASLEYRVPSGQEYAEAFKRQIAKVSDANGAVLAEYVAHRKVVLELLELALRQKDNGNFQKESFLHNLIYPMRSSSEETSYNSHNLWLIDEKLSYCSYISSDIPFGNDPKQDRTDVMILDSPVAISDEISDGTEYGTIVLFELKRPMRDDYTDGVNPINQLYRYVSYIKSGKAKDRYGRLIKVSAKTRFYLYAICDITQSMKWIIDINGFSEMPDKMGYYKYNDNFNAYVEILPYDKIINDAKKRNKILFDKLGI